MFFVLNVLQFVFSVIAIESKSSSTYGSVAPLLETKITEGKPPPLPIKSYSKSNSNKDSSSSIDNSAFQQHSKLDSSSLNKSISSEIALFSDEFGKAEGSSALPNNGSSKEGFANFDILKPPTNDKRQPTNLPLPASKPRPKSNQVTKFT